MYKHRMAEAIRGHGSYLKIETRRMLTVKRVYSIGSIQPIQENYFDKAVDHVKILNRWQERLGDMTPQNLLNEGGFLSLNDYLDYLRQINKKDANLITPDLEVRAYSFKYLPPRDTVALVNAYLQKLPNSACYTSLSEIASTLEFPKPIVNEALEKLVARNDVSKLGKRSFLYGANLWRRF